MVIDCHVHCHGNEKAKDVLKTMDKCGMDKIFLLAPPPRRMSTAESIDCVAKIARESKERIIPFAWIEPTLRGAVAEVERAVSDSGIKGVKMIPNRWFPWEERCFPVYEKIEELQVPILFHSGILWSYGDTSRFCKPVNFEIMLEFPGIRFALAHIGWPWTEECMAVLGKVRASRRRKDMDPKQMFIDITPGTPPSRRREIMKMALDLAGEDYLLFGTDNGALGDRSKVVLQRDRKIFASLGTSKRAQNKMFGENAMKFLYGEKSN